MQCYSELAPPTAVTHSVGLPFLHAKASNLVVAKTSVLQIFELKTVSTEAAANANDGAQSPQDSEADAFDLSLHRLEQTCKLVLVSEHVLSGTVISLKRVKTINTKSGGDALLIAFREAKLTLVEWDPESFSVSTISVHYYEGESLQTCPWAPELSLCRNYLTVDPNSRCAALKFGQRHLAILPFRQIVDDLGEDDFDEEMEDAPEKSTLERRATGTELTATPQTPYSSSFVLSLTTLDPSLTHPIHLAFLHEYHEPTFGIMSSVRSLGAALLHERKDTVNYTVFTLDIEQRASTTILTVSGLPNDLYEVIPLPLPVGGALLLGTNELVHVDEAGKTNAVAVNEFAKEVSAFAMADQSDLSLRLEGCVIQQIGDSGHVLIVLKSGELAILTFSLEGRSVLGLHVHKVPADRGGAVLPTGVSCASSLGRGRVFMGSDDTNAVILGWSKKAAQLTRKRSRADMMTEDAEESFDEADLDDDDDIYGNDAPTEERTSRNSMSDSSDPTSYIFRIHDKLPNYAPVGDISLGDSSAPFAETKDRIDLQTTSKLELLYPTGRGIAGGLARLKREIDPQIHIRTEIPNAKALWSLHPRRSAVKELGKAQESNDQLSVDVEFDEYVVVSLVTESGSEESALYSVTSKGLKPTEKEDFDAEAGATIEIGTIAGGTKIVQVLRDEVKCYDAGKSPSISLVSVYAVCETRDLVLRVFGMLTSFTMTSIITSLLPCVGYLCFHFGSFAEAVADLSGRPRYSAQLDYDGTCRIAQYNPVLFIPAPSLLSCVFICLAFPHAALNIDFSIHQISALSRSFHQSMKSQRTSSRSLVPAFAIHTCSSSGTTQVSLSFKSTPLASWTN
jgi:cleavage and polyadenylation specificity factor subunit 1